MSAAACARVALAALALAAAPAPAAALPVRLASIFGPGMVLQRDADVGFWGWGRPSATVYASLMNAATNQTLQAQAAADAAGAWRLAFPPQPASGAVWRLLLASSPVDLARCDAFQFYCSGASAAVNGISFGDVHLCIGQVCAARARGRASGGGERAEAAR